MIHMSSLQKNSKTILLSSIILFFSYQMFRIIWPYTTWRTDIDFLQTKYHIIHLSYYKMAFYGHIFSSMLVLPAGAFLFSNWLLKNFSTLHRWIGKSYVGLVLCISAPTGMIMAFHANGGWMAQVSFLILTPLWWWSTYLGYRTARQLDFKAHKRWMIRSYALTFSAISLRLYQFILTAFSHLEAETQYILVSWLSWIGNLIMVELWLERKSLMMWIDNSIRLKKMPKVFSQMKSLPTSGRMKG